MKLVRYVSQTVLHLGETTDPQKAEVQFSVHLAVLLRPSFSADTDAPFSHDADF